jgi:DNA-binding MarR family transcriptional regulator
LLLWTPLVTAGDEPRLTDSGLAAMARVEEARQEALADLVHGWHPEEDAELRDLLDRTARDFAAAPPAR